MLPVSYSSDNPLRSRATQLSYYKTGQSNLVCSATTRWISSGYNTCDIIPPSYITVNTKMLFNYNLSIISEVLIIALIYTSTSSFTKLWTTGNIHVSFWPETAELCIGLEGLDKMLLKTHVQHHNHHRKIQDQYICGIDHKNTIGTIFVIVFHTTPNVVTTRSMHCIVVWA